jgi:hypothetical protein
LKKRVEIEVELYGDGTVREERPGCFTGGVPDPDLSGVTFTVHQEHGEYRSTPFEGRLQVNVYGTSEGYAQLARYFLALAVLDTTADPDFHEHQDALESEGGLTRLDLIFRKNDHRAV